MNFDGDPESGLEIEKFLVEYHSSMNFDGDLKSRLKIEKFLVDMPFLGWGLIFGLHIYTGMTD